jgi:hypothetical protein
MVDIVERMAHAMSQEDNDPMPFEEMPPLVQSAFRRMARAALRSLLTKEMVEAGRLDGERFRVGDTTRFSLLSVTLMRELISAETQATS